MIRRISFVGMSFALGTVALMVASLSWADASRPREGEAAQKQVLKPKVAKPLRAAQEAIEKENWDEAFARVEEAQAVADRGPYDDFQISEMLGYVELKRQRYPQASAAFEKSVDSGLLPPEQVGDRLKLITQLAMQLKDYPKAIQFADRAIAATPDAQPDIYALRGQAQYLSGDYRGATASMAAAVERARKAGQPPEENWLQVQLSGHAQLKDEAGVLRALQALAIAFPKKAYLEDLFAQWKRTSDDDRSLHHLYRLMFRLNLLGSAEDYLKLAELAVEMGFPGEAIRVLERGKKDGKFADEVDAEHARRKLETAKSAAIADRKTVAAMEASTEPKSGDEEAAFGMALASYEQYVKALEALERGIAKGGIRRPDQAQLLLGQVLLELNRPADAQAAFAKVEPSAPLGTVAQLWRVYSAEPAPLG
jgi:tetratricopeptide (TPR) repeat protein